MSNDRLFIRCVHCNAAELLGKSWHGQAAGVDGSPDDLADFINEHVESCGNPFQRGKIDMGREPGFRFETEETMCEVRNQIASCG